MWTLKEKKNFQNIETFTNIENKPTVTKEDRAVRGGVNQVRVNIYALLYMKWMTNKDPLYSL